jgi:Tol biopolymer transport system component
LFGFGGSWGDDGNIVVALRNSAGSNTSLWQIASSGGSVQPVKERAQLHNSVLRTWPQILPGAQVVLYTAFGPTAGTFEQAAIETLSLRTGERKTLVSGGYYGRFLPSGHLLYMHRGTLYAAPMDAKRLALTGPPVPVIEEISSNAGNGLAQMDVARNGTLVYVRGRTAGKTTLNWLDGAGQTRPLRPTAAEYEPSIHFSPDGERLALSLTERGNDDVWIYDWERDTMTRLTFSGSDGIPVWSPDGKHVAFSSTRNGDSDNLFWMRADGAGEAVRLTEGKNSQFAFSFSPDGKRLAFVELDPHTNTDLWTLSLEDPESDHPKVGKPEPFLVTPFNEMTPTISPDGHWLAYSSDESGRSEVYVRPFPGPGGKSQVSTASGAKPVWSKKEHELFYRNGEGMMVVSYTANAGAFVAGKPRVWVSKKDLGDYFDLAPDGKRFVVEQAEGPEQSAPTQLTFLLNFSDELRRRAPAKK